MLRRDFDGRSIDRHVRALKTCYKEKCCTAGRLSTLALGVELKIVQNGYRYADNPQALADQLHAIRQLTGNLFFLHSRFLDYRAPSAAVAIGRMAEAYLAHTLFRQIELDATEQGLAWTRYRIAESLVSRNRFEPVPQPDLEWVRDEGLTLMTGGEPRLALSGRHLLVRAILGLLPTGHNAVPEALWQGLPADISAHARLFVDMGRLALTQQDLGNSKHIETGLSYLRAVATEPQSPRTSQVMAGVLLAWHATQEEFGGRGPSLVGLRTPLDFPRHLAGVSDDPNIAAVVERFITNLERLFPEETISLYLRLVAGLHDIAAQWYVKNGDVEAGLAHYRAALTAGKHASRRNADESLRVVERHFEVARLAQDGRVLASALQLLDDNAVFRAFSVHPYLSLTRQMERGGLPDPENAACPIADQHDCVISLYSRGKPPEVYEVAGRRALRNSTMERLDLGGRSGAQMPMSISNFADSTSVVIKRTNLVNLARERESLARLAANRSPESEWRTGQLIGFEEIQSGGSGQEQVAVFWRWADGISASQYLVQHASRRADLLVRLSRSLAQLHLGLQPEFGAIRQPPTGVRQAYRRGPAGMWLRRLVVGREGSSGPLELFSAWFDAVAGLALPWTPRTDAHLNNWIIEGDEERIVRVDLEAVGWAPFAYELAQLTDDIPLLGHSEEAWEIRRRCFISYLDGLRVLERPAEEGRAWNAYLLALALRAARPLSSGIAGDESEEALSLLKAVRHRAADDTTRELAEGLSAAWAQRDSLEVDQGIDELVDLVERPALRRASKTLAWLLRHDTAITRSAEGWVDLDQIVRRFAEIRTYAGLTEIDIEGYLVSLIGSFDDRDRFEHRDGRVRARYGHSVPMAYGHDTEGPVERPTLYHGTTYEAMKRIYAKGGQLLPMNRSWVHFSSDIREAWRVGSRHGVPLVLELPHDAVGVGPVVRVTDQTWVTGTIPGEQLRMLPLHRFAFSQRLPPPP